MKIADYYDTSLVGMTNGAVGMNDVETEDPEGENCAAMMAIGGTTTSAEHPAYTESSGVVKGLNDGIALTSCMPHSRCRCWIMSPTCTMC